MSVFLQIAPFVLLTLGTAVCVWTFLSLKKEIFALSKKVSAHQSRLDAVQSLNETVSREIEALRVRLAEAEDRAGVLVAPAPPRSGLNLNKRSQVMRMARNGEAPETIASALNLPRKEVELLLKVQQILVGRHSGAPSVGTTS